MKFRHLAIAASLAAAHFAAFAAPVSFSVSAAGFTPGAGYGSVDTDGANGKGGTLLDVTFGTLAGAHAATLSAGSNFSFDFGTISLGEKWIDDPAETDALGVSAEFVFTNPLSGTSVIIATGTAFVGQVSDSAADFAIDWNDQIVSFGNGGSFRIAMADVSFTASGAQTQTATITLLAEPATAAPTATATPTATSDVPEPGSVALAGLALLGLAATRRRSRR